MSKRLTMADRLAEKEMEIVRLREEIASVRNRLTAAEVRASDLPGWEKRVDALEEAAQSLRDQRDTGVEALAKVQKELDALKSTNSYNSQRGDKAEAELEQCHAAIDAVEGAPSRTYEKSYGEGTRSVTSRLIGAFLKVSKGSF